MTLDHILGIAYNREQEDGCVGSGRSPFKFLACGKAAACLGGGYFFMRTTFSEDTRNQDAPLVDIMHGTPGPPREYNEPLPTSQPIPALQWCG